MVSHSGKAEPGEKIRFLAAILAERGYRTAAVDNLGRWFTRGFARVETYRWPLEEPYPLGIVTAPRAADETMAAYFAKTPVR